MNQHHADLIILHGCHSNSRARRVVPQMCPKCVIDLQTQHFIRIAWGEVTCSFHSQRVPAGFCDCKLHVQLVSETALLPPVPKVTKCILKKFEKYSCTELQLNSLGLKEEGLHLHTPATLGISSFQPFPRDECHSFTYAYAYVSAGTIRQRRRRIIVSHFGICT